MQPLMTIAGIETKMLVTERVGHARDTLMNADLSDFHVRNFYRISLQFSFRYFI